ncbi:hypothetical protein FGIG_06060 [Fasciola gigantica]|uniref:Uncharacterized protein n=1 Tax=Fasciola gigantica TaxID=46835 RepID=A0A504YRU2_FASGI|nr:hypothetical protein FGIG_06060 [Fasciola gigantica]
MCIYLGLTRACTPAVVQFRKADGFSAVLKVIQNFANDAAAKAVCDKGSFFIFCLLQEVIESSLDENEAKNLTNTIISLCLQLLHVNEHLLAGLIMLFTNSVSVDAAIDVENLPHGTAKRASRFVDEGLRKSFVHWLSQMDSRFAESDDPADAELRSYIGVLLNLLNKE